MCAAQSLFLQANGQDKKVFRGNNAPIKSVPAAGQESSSSIENCSTTGTRMWKGAGRQHGWTDQHSRIYAPSPDPEYEAPLTNGEGRRNVCISLRL